MPNNISSLGQQINIIKRVKEMQTRMADLQEQIASGVKSQTFAGYGANALRIQNYRSSKTENDTYLYNIEIAQTNIEQMTSAIDETIEQSQNVLKAVSTQLAKGSEFDMESIKSAAASALEIIKANMNVKVGDRYLFAGTDVLNQPYKTPDAATSNIQDAISDWLDGTTASPDALMTALDGLTDSQLGYSTTIQTSKDVFVRADDGLEVNYTVKATDDGFKSMVVGLTALANLQMPATTDMATKDDFYNVLDSLYKKIQGGVQSLRDSTTDIAAASQVIDSVKTRLEDDNQTILQTMENTEATDTTAAVVTFQSLQNQLDASYRITSILSQLSLARLLSG